tara:strand:- start:118 stop:408 length:291 start_codon:yes stop_codon:yes gene_type:complete
MVSAKITPIVNHPPRINPKPTMKQITNIIDKTSQCGDICLNNNEKDVCLEAPGSVSLKNTENNNVSLETNGNNNVSLETNGNSNDDCNCCCCCDIL